MSRPLRKDEFLPHEVNAYHCFNRTVRRSFLHGIDPLTGVDHSHRRQWFRGRMSALATHFCIEVLAFAVMSNHWHCVLRNRPDLVKAMSNREVAIRWLSITYRKKTAKNPHGRPTEAEINATVHDPTQMAEIRSRLSDISWFVRLLCQTVACKCNIEDECSGRFFEDRFKMNRLDDPDWQVSIGERLRCLPMDLAAYERLLWHLALESRPELQASYSLKAEKLRGTPTLRDQEINIEKLREAIAKFQQRCNASLGKHACKAIRARIAAQLQEA